MIVDVAVAPGTWVRFYREVNGVKELVIAEVEYLISDDAGTPYLCTALGVPPLSQVLEARNRTDEVEAAGVGDDGPN